MRHKTFFALGDHLNDRKAFRSIFALFFHTHAYVYVYTAAFLFVFVFFHVLSRLGLKQNCPDFIKYQLYKYNIHRKIQPQIISGITLCTSVRSNARCMLINVIHHSGFYRNYFYCVRSAFSFVNDRIFFDLVTPMNFYYSATVNQCQGNGARLPT